MLHRAGITGRPCRAERFAREVLPADVHLRVTRDYGQTADHKVNELVDALLVAIAVVVLLLAYTLGWREGILIALAVPVTFSFTLLINLFLGYTINRVTLFALILSLGLVVDDPIVDVENIHRHFTQRKAPPHRAVVEAVNEVRPPIILATLAVIVSFLPMFFITGMMGTTWTGTSSPMDFNGLVRHYYLRQGANVADIRFNFIGKKYRSQQSHAIGLRLRNDLKAIAERYGANIKIVESPPGPPRDLDTGGGSLWTHRATLRGTGPGGGKGPSAHGRDAGSRGRGRRPGGP
ncbi:hypothetical protein DSTSK_19450 [Desulforhabdus sp. TSK]|nr:hypothetical protein DSTSK_19450 [Desulforhabdus sp. TSK]